MYYRKELKDMFTRFISCLLIFFSVGVCSLNAKTITAKSYDDAIHKIQKKMNDPFYDYDYIAMQRHYFLLHHRDKWEYDNQKSDTIYVCIVTNLNGLSYDEYIITPERIYSSKSAYGWSLKCKVLSSREEYNNMINSRCVNYIMKWDVGLFKRWKTSTINDVSYIDAIRIVRISNRKYQYEYYSFCDNYWEENVPIPISD